jgi:hypothetical protein
MKRLVKQSVQGKKMPVATANLAFQSFSYLQQLTSSETLANLIEVL